jgi:hypothetical protein
MAKGKKTGGRDFKKGEGGRKPLPPEIKAISNATKPQIISAYWKIANLSVESVREFKPENLIEAGIMKCVLDFAKTGKTSDICKIWAECHGRPVESHDIKSDGPIEIVFRSVDKMDEI